MMQIPMRTAGRWPRWSAAAALAGALAGGTPVRGQETGGGSAPAGPRSAAQVLDDLQGKAAQGAEDLAKLRSSIEEEKIPLMKEISRLEEALAATRKEYEEVLRIRDARTLDLSNIKAKITAREAQNEYLANLLDEYTRNFESRLHVAESQRYGERLAGAKRRLKADLALEETFGGRFDLVDLSLDRLEEVAGGTAFAGSATDADGIISEGRFVLLGPIGFFSAETDGPAGLADSRIESSEPSVVAVPETVEPSIRAFASSGEGDLPIDITEGQALKLAETRETVWEEIEKGGYVMYPLLGLGALSVVIAFFKWLQMAFVKRISPKRFRKLLAHLDENRPVEAGAQLKGVWGPIGHLLRTGIENRREPPALVEEVMYEDMLEARAKLNSLIPFIKITAAAAPLLGLLGTVSGMINTFKLITVFGTGDASTFSSGISEALITTKWGLIVAIPCLLVAAFLTRKAKGVLDDMEKLALAFINHLRGDDEREEEASDVGTDHADGDGDGGRAPRRPDDRGAPAPPPAASELGPGGEAPASA